MLLKNKLFRLSATLILPALLLASCGAHSPITVPATPLALPAQAKVSKVATPSECLPTCSAGWAKLVNESADTLTK